MYILDTDTLTWAHGGHSGIAERVRQAGEENVVTTVVTEVEILRGRQDFLFKAADGTQLLRAQELLDSSRALLAEIVILPVDEAAAAEFDKLRQQKKLKKLGRGDLLIASIALVRRATVVTRNVKHFQQVPTLAVENWVD
jgi:tRNA(fMet)-specific endonuclease VapC